jgi:hypothetical protein
MSRVGMMFRLALVLAVIAFIAMVVLFGRWLGLSEILIVGLLIVLFLLAEGARVVLVGFWRGYRGEG